MTADNKVEMKPCPTCHGKRVVEVPCPGGECCSVKAATTGMLLEAGLPDPIKHVDDCPTCSKPPKKDMTPCQHVSKCELPPWSYRHDSDQCGYLHPFVPYPSPSSGDARVLDALAWALEYIADGTDPSEGETPRHDCEFESNPEKAACDFHEKYFDAQAKLSELRTTAKPAEDGLREAVKRVYEKAKNQEYEEMPGGHSTGYDCQLGDARHVMRQVEADLEAALSVPAPQTPLKCKKCECGVLFKKGRSEKEAFFQCDVCGYCPITTMKNGVIEIAKELEAAPQTSAEREK